MLVFRKLFFLAIEKYIHKNGKLYWCRRDCQDAFLALLRSPGAKYQTPKYSARALRWAGDSSAFLIHHKWNQNGIKNLSFDVLIASCQLLQLCFIFSFICHKFKFLLMAYCHQTIVNILSLAIWEPVGLSLLYWLLWCMRDMNVLAFIALKRKQSLCFSAGRADNNSKVLWLYQTSWFCVCEFCGL